MALSDFLPINQIVENQAKELQSDLLTSMDGLSMKFGTNRQTNSLRKFTRVRVGQRDGVADKISVKFPRHGVFLKKGVGRGTKIGQVGSTRRRPKDWANPVIEKHHKELTDKIAEVAPAAVISEVKSMLIK